MISHSPNSQSSVYQTRIKTKSKSSSGNNWQQSKHLQEDRKEKDTEISSTKEQRKLSSQQSQKSNYTTKKGGMASSISIYFIFTVKYTTE